ncbi:MAG: YraN family protein [Flavobacteriales bacterium]|nr:YraN family protein [Flavobacteriales bacterium]
MSNNSNIILGREGEKAALKFLQNNGYKLLHKNWRHKKMEIDLVVKKQNKVVFVEVKTRKNAINSLINDVVSFSQQKRIIDAAHNYIDEFNVDEDIRFDLIEVHMPNKSPKFVHHKDFTYPTL